MRLSHGEYGCVVWERSCAANGTILNRKCPKLNIPGVLGHRDLALVLSQVLQPLRPGILKGQLPQVQARLLCHGIQPILLNGLQGARGDLELHPALAVSPEHLLVLQVGLLPLAAVLVGEANVVGLVALGASQVAHLLSLNTRGRPTAGWLPKHRAGGAGSRSQGHAGEGTLQHHILAWWMTKARVPIRLMVEGGIDDGMGFCGCASLLRGQAAECLLSGSVWVQQNPCVSKASCVTRLLT